MCSVLLSLATNVGQTIFLYILRQFRNWVYLFHAYSFSIQNRHFSSFLFDALSLALTAVICGARVACLCIYLCIRACECICNVYIYTYISGNLVSLEQKTTEYGQNGVDFSISLLSLFPISLIPLTDFFSPVCASRLTKIITKVILLKTLISMLVLLVSLVVDLFLFSHLVV